jgi:hypothetical protein
MWVNRFVWTPPGPYIAGIWSAGVAIGITTGFIFRPPDTDARRYRFWMTGIVLLAWTLVAGLVHFAIAFFAFFARSLAAPMRS